MQQVQKLRVIHTSEKTMLRRRKQAVSKHFSVICTTNQKIANGFTGEPLPPSTGIGANVSMNS